MYTGMVKRRSGAQHEFGFMREDAEGNELPPPHTDADYVPPAESDAPLEFTEEEQRILAQFTDPEARPRPTRAKQARSAVERALDRAAEDAWKRAILAAATAGNFDEATRIANAGFGAFRSSASSPDLPDAA